MAAQLMERIDLADDQGSIALYDHMAEEVKDGRNLMRLDARGHILWKASPPAAAQDCFTGMQWVGRTLIANTWSCYRVDIDLRNGDVTMIAFTK
ncbi:hypothetical protein [Methylopila sp. M107]|uniref:hypothetical protein n=1 Tax=Methylopila sp. M107 TaxID=1101190 RepID=UPI0003815074|nr:hypothetical protein [Methylopila sp. M107]